MRADGVLGSLDSRVGRIDSSGGHCLLRPRCRHKQGLSPQRRETSLRRFHGDQFDRSDVSYRPQSFIDCS